MRYENSTGLLPGAVWMWNRRSTWAALVRVDVVDRIRADELVGFVAQQTAHRRARVLVDAVGRVQADEVRRALGEGPEARLRLGQSTRPVGQRGAKCLLLRDVHGFDDDDSHRGVGIVARHYRGEQHVDGHVDFESRGRVRDGSA